MPVTVTPVGHREFEKNATGTVVSGAVVFPRPLLRAPGTRVIARDMLGYTFSGCVWPARARWMDPQTESRYADVGPCMWVAAWTIF